MPRTNPHNLSLEEEADIDRFIRIVVASGEGFAGWAKNAITKDGRHLFGHQRGQGSLYHYCKDTKFKNKRRSLQRFREGNDIRTAWTPLTRIESDPTDWLQALYPIRKLTDEEFENQSIMAKGGGALRGRSRSTTPNRDVRFKGVGKKDGDAM